MTLSLILTLLIVGFLLIGIEVFVTPGFVVGLIGFGFLVAGVYLSYTIYDGNTIGHIVLTSTGVLLALGLFYTFKSGFWSKISLKDTIENIASPALTLKEGEIGRTISTLRPSGTALFSGKTFEVWSEGQQIDTQTEIIISKIQEHKIFVKSLNK